MNWAQSLDFLFLFVLPVTVTLLCTNIVFESRILAYVVATLVTAIITTLVPSDARVYAGAGAFFMGALPAYAILCGVVALILKKISKKNSHDDP